MAGGTGTGRLRVYLRGAAALATCGALAVATGCGDEDPATVEHRSVTVFAASSLTEVFGDIAEAFEAAHPDIEVTLQFAGSSRLATQINAGAPADIFAAADERTAAQVTAGRVAIFARNRLAIAVPPGNPAGVSGLDSLGDADLVLALCASEVPCGALTELVGGPELGAAADTREPSVRGVLTKVLLGEVDAGVVYVTDVLAAGDTVTAIPIDHAASTPYPLALLNESAEASAFVDFVLSPAAQELLAAAGFEAP